MKRLAVGAAVLMVMAALDAGHQSQAARWCAWSGPYTYNCGFYTLQQCRATVSGEGGWCAPNVREGYAAHRGHHHWQQ